MANNSFITNPLDPLAGALGGTGFATNKNYSAKSASDFQNMSVANTFNVQGNDPMNFTPMKSSTLYPQQTQPVQQPQQQGPQADPSQNTWDETDWGNYQKATKAGVPYAETVKLVNTRKQQRMQEMQVQQQAQQSQQLQGSSKTLLPGEDKGEWNDNFFGRMDTFDYKEGDSTISKVGKGAYNIVGSTVNLASDIGNVVLNPFDTFKNVAEIPGMVNEYVKYKNSGMDPEAYAQSVGSDDAQQLQQSVAMGDWLSERYGGWDKLANTLYEDPAGLISDVAGLVTGVGGAIKGSAVVGGKLGLLSKVSKVDALADISKASKFSELSNFGKVAKVGDTIMDVGNAVDPATYLVKGAGKVAGKGLEYGQKGYETVKGVVKGATDGVNPGISTNKIGSMLSGMEPDTLDFAVKKKDLFDQAVRGDISETKLSQEIQDIFDATDQERRLGGGAYEELYKSQVEINGSDIYNNATKNLEDLGIKRVDGDIVIDRSKYKVQSGEANKIKEGLAILDDIKDVPLDAQGAHMIRQNMDELTKWSEGIDKKSSKAMEMIRDSIDTQLKEKVAGWAEVDQNYKLKAQEIKDFKKTFFDKEGNVKQDVLNKLGGSLLNSNYSNKLEKMKQYIPDIADRVMAIRSAKDFFKAQGHKVGTYARGVMRGAGAGTGMGVGALAGGLPGAIAGAVSGYIGMKITDPEVIVSLLRKLEKNAPQIAEKLQDGAKLSKEEANIVKKTAGKVGAQNKGIQIEKAKKEAIKKDFDTKMENLRKTPALPEKTEAYNKGTPKNPYVAQDLRDPETIAKAKQAKADFDAKKKVATDEYQSMDKKVKNGELFDENGEKIKDIKRSSYRPYQPVEATTMDGRKIDLKKDKLYELKKDAEVKNGLDTLKKSEPAKVIDNATDKPRELTKQDLEIMPWDDAEEIAYKQARAKELGFDNVENVVKGESETVDLESMSDKDFNDYMSKADPEGPEAEIINNEWIRRNVMPEIQNDGMLKLDRKHISDIAKIEAQEQRVGTVAGKKVINSDYRKQQGSELSIKREKKIEEIAQDYNVDQFEASDMYDNFVNQIRYQKAVQEATLVEKSVAEATVYKYFGKDEINLNFLDSITTPDGQDAFGRYYRRTIEMINNPHKTTASHEVAHAYFDMFTSQDDKAKILDQLKNEFDIVDDLDAEEKLADGFFDYIKGKENLGFGGQIMDYFKTVWNDIKRLFGSGDKVKGFYDDIMSKKRKNVQDLAKKEIAYQRAGYQMQGLFDNIDNMSPTEVASKIDVIAKDKDIYAGTLFEFVEAQADISDDAKKIVTDAINSITEEKPKTVEVTKPSNKLDNLGKKPVDTVDPNASIEAQVEARLKQAQANKEFKDVGRLEGSRKEKSAYRILTSDNLAEIEAKGEAFAKDMIKKEKVVANMDISELRNAGEDAGLVWMKKKLIDSITSKPSADPKNSYKRSYVDPKLAREMYVNVLPNMVADIVGAKTVQDLKTIGSDIKTLWSSSNKNGHFMLYNGVEYDVSDVFGKSFLNTLKGTSDAGVQARDKAFEYTGITQDILDDVVEKQRMGNKVSLEQYVNYWDEQQERVFSKDRSKYKEGSDDYNRFMANKNLSITRKENELAGKLKAIQEKYKVRDADRSWYDKEKKEVVRNVDDERANQFEKIEKVERTSKKTVDMQHITPKAISDKYGFKNVEYGNYMNDVDSKKATKNFLEAMTDMEDVLGVDMKKLNNEMGLTVGFGSRGTKGSLAHYNPGYKFININKGVGDGSIAHERGHALDHFISGGDEFATVMKSPKTEPQRIMKEIVDQMVVGDGTKTKMSFDATVNKPMYLYHDLTRLHKSGNIDGLFEKAGNMIAMYTKKGGRDAKHADYVGAYLSKLMGKPVDIDVNMPKSEYLVNAESLEGGKGKKYRSTTEELLARAFETYIADKGAEKGIINNYLVQKVGNIVKYPKGVEMQKLSTLFDKLFAELSKGYSKNTGLDGLGKK